MLVSFINVSKIAFVIKGILLEFRTTNTMPKSTTRKHFCDEREVSGSHCTRVYILLSFVFFAIR